MTMRMTPRALLCFAIALAGVSLAGCLESGERGAEPQDVGPAAVPITDSASGDGAKGGPPAEGTTPSRENARVCGAVSVSDTPAEARGDEDAPACRCTRRPGPGESFQCPAGSGQSVVQRVGPEGGVIELSGTASTVGVTVRLEIPPNALTEDVSLRLTETSLPPPDSFVDWSPLYHLEPDGLRFARPVVVRVPWSSNDGEVDVDLALYASTADDACTIAPLGDSYVNAGFNQGSLHASGWMLVGRPRTRAESACP